jgi:DNA replication protein DnaC
MVNFQESPNSLLDAFEKIHQVSESSCLNPANLFDCQQEVEEVCQFFECQSQAAILLALLLRQHYQNEEPSVKVLIEHTGIKGSASVHINRLLEEFVTKDWLKPRQDIRYFPFTNYKFQNRFIHCVTTKDWSHLRPQPIKNSFDLLDRFSKVYKERKINEVTYNKLADATEGLLSENEQLSICAFIQEVGMEPLESICFLSMCYRHYRGNETFDFDSLLEEIAPPLQEQFRFRQMLKGKKAVFFELELVDEKCSENMLFASVEYRLTETAIRSFNPDPVSEKKKLKSSTLEIIEPEKIKPKNLFYGENEKIQMKRLFDLIEVEHFEKFCKRMEEKGMNAGLTILLYGSPGTGKTESVLQLAQRSNRIVMMADASSIRSKWVGETEKNIKKLFTEYKQAIDTYDHVPILLFNEADAILGSRRLVSDRVEQMENTLQNILLQELENFRGIFIATTNLEENLDPAFDRRILYKVRFNTPTDEMRESIWKDKLPGLSEDLVRCVNSRHKLTGGQIDNVAKKVEVSLLLDPNTVLTGEYLTFLASEEVSLRAGQHRSPIGFTRNTISK